MTFYELKIGQLFKADTGAVLIKHSVTQVNMILDRNGNVVTPLGSSSAIRETKLGYDEPIQFKVPPTPVKLYENFGEVGI